MKINEIYKGKFLKAEQLKTGPGTYKTLVLTIEGASMHQFDDGKDQIVLSFEGSDQQLGLSKTTAMQVAEIAGSDDTDDWVGKEIELFVDKTVRFKGTLTPSIRVRVPSKGKKATATEAPPDDEDGQGPSIEGVTDKLTAWDYFSNRQARDGVATAGINANWKKVLAKFGKDVKDFGPEDWRKVAEASEIPF